MTAESLLACVLLVVAKLLLVAAHCMLARVRRRNLLRNDRLSRNCCPQCETPLARRGDILVCYFCNLGVYDPSRP